MRIEENDAQLIVDFSSKSKSRALSKKSNWKIRMPPLWRNGYRAFWALPITALWAKSKEPSLGCARPGKNQFERMFF